MARVLCIRLLKVEISQGVVNAIGEFRAGERRVAGSCMAVLPSVTGRHVLYSAATAAGIG